MPSEAEKNKALAKQQEAELATARAEVDTDRQKFLEGKTPPLVRDADHSYVEPEFASTDPAVVNPDLTATGTTMRSVEDTFLAEEATVKVKHDNGETSQVIPDAAAVERMSDEEIKKSGLLRNNVAEQTVHPARLAPSSERPRTPLQRAPAAGPGTWPVPADALPAAMPSDPGPDEVKQELGDVSFASMPGFSTKESGDLGIKSTRRGLEVVVPKKQVAAAAALWLSLKQQFPHTPHDELRDEFSLQLESMIGMPQSQRPASEVSHVDVTAVGDPRTSTQDIAVQRQDTTDEPPSRDEQIKALVKDNDEAALRSMASQENIPIPADWDKPQIAGAIVDKRAENPSDAAASGTEGSGPKVAGGDDAKQ